MTDHDKIEAIKNELKGIEPEYMTLLELKIYKIVTNNEPTTDQWNTSMLNTKSFVTGIDTEG